MEEGGAAVMLVRQVIGISIVASMFFLSSAAGDQLRYYQENGITYCETLRTVQRPVYETTMQQTTRTVYKEQYYTETKDVTQTCLYPVTSYRAETYWVGRWNPFVDPYLATEWIPQTCWQQRTQVVKTPVTCRRLVPEAQTVQAPVTTQKLVSDEVVVGRVAVSGPGVRMVQQNYPTYPSPARTYVGTAGPIYSGEPIGGIARLNQDPPRYGVGTGGSSLSTR
jgi:hypothetical protein